MNRTIVLVLAFILAGVPSAMAAWYGPGTVEPDTEWDEDLALMWADADNSVDQATKKVYFNAFPVGYLTGYNPNVGALETHFTPYTVHIHGMIGVWKDCNNDGYIGHIENVMSEYRAELLQDNTICPAGTSMHNDGEWVYEFFAMGPVNEANAPAYNVINTTMRTDDVRTPGVWMWGDLGRPGALPGFSCPLSPPYGSTATTGGMIRWMDCSGGGTMTRSVNNVDSDGSLGLRFEDPNNPQDSSSALNIHAGVTVWGDPKSDQPGLLENGNSPTYNTWDCSAAPTHVRDPTAADGESGELRRVGVRDPTGLVQNQTVEGVGNVTLINQNGYVGANLNNISDDSGDIARVYSPAPGVASDPTKASLADALNETERGILNDCDPESTTFSEIVAALSNPEGPLQSDSQSAVGKDEVGSTFSFFDGSQSRDQVKTVLGQSTPSYLGVGGQNPTATAPPVWISTTIITSEEFYVSPESGPTAKRYFTFYAYVHPEIVGSNSVILPGNGATRIYGSDNCATIGAGQPTQQGWACDPDLWYLDHFSGKDLDPNRTNVRLGHEYQFRDVDCFTGLIVDLETNTLSPC